MFVFNMKINSKAFKRYFWIGGIVIFTILIILICYKSLYKNFSFFKVNDDCNVSENYEIDASQYTNILRAVHENVDDYIGQKIKFTGYVYRVYDFNSTQFVLARNMVLTSDYQTVVVGFLCEHEESSNFADGTWVEIEGIIEKGNYHGTIPVIKISNIKGVNPPPDEYVYPPDDTYIATSNLH